MKQWGINRNYLKYIEGLLTREEMRKEISHELLRLNHGGHFGVPGDMDLNP